jgi:hypothetical protein
MAPTKPKDEPDYPPVDESTEGWETVQEESPTVIVFDTPGEHFTGIFRGEDHITPEDENKEPFSRFRFIGGDKKPYALNQSHNLRAGMQGVQVGELVRITYVKAIPVPGQPSPLKDHKVEVKRGK